MQKEINLILRPKQATDEKFFLPIAAKKLNISIEEISQYRIIKKSIDARKPNIKINLKLLIIINEENFIFENTLFDYQNVSNKEEVVIIGTGPAGLFAALRLIELGLKPILFERGKDVSERKLDIAKINREQIVNPDSNYAFGEGGAGTFSDGKLYTRSKKRGSVKRILDILNLHGASQEILYEAHPHIGTNKLSGVIKEIRETILNAGGEIHFNSKLTDIKTVDNTVKSITINNNQEIDVKRLVLATGHSARDVYEILHKNEILIEPKAFAIGVRVEHPQKLVDSIQYHCEIRSDYLPAANYNLVKQIDGRGVYSFCMCPGGFIVPAATEQNQIVVNGMSPAKRDSKYANSGIVVEIKHEDLKDFEEYGALAGVKYQEFIENLAHKNGGDGQIAPAQRLKDFVEGKKSESLPETSYHPGVVSSDIHKWLPENISKRLQKGFVEFNKSMKGYLTNEAIILGVESRTSSPVRIPRDKETLEHTQIKGLYPCGEGAGYAGGIVSSAVDGERIAEKIKSAIQSN